MVGSLGATLKLSDHQSACNTYLDGRHDKLMLARVFTVDNISSSVWLRTMAALPLCLFVCRAFSVVWSFKFGFTRGAKRT